MAEKLGLEGCAEVEGFDGGVWEYKGRQYVVSVTHGSAMKDPTSGEWSAVVAYSPLDPQNDEPRTYYRDREDFLAKFKRVDKSETE